MKAQMKIAGLMVLAFLGSAAMADASDAKTSTRIDFNRMIDDNNNARKVLHKDIDQKAAAAATDGESDAERAKVVDFVDVEVGWGESAPVVDRRFDSIGAARPYKMNEEALETQDSGT
jgi:hypothetical protein